MERKETKRHEAERIEITEWNGKERRLIFYKNEKIRRETERHGKESNKKYSLFFENGTERNGTERNKKERN